MDQAVFLGLELLLSHFWVVPLGVLAGMFIGGIPGLSPPNALAVMLPILIVFPPEVGLIFCVSLYVGAEMGNSFPAVTLNIPGTAAAAVTAIEGYPLRSQGKAARALGICIMASTIGAVIGGIVSITGAPLLAMLALKFSAVEICIVVLFGLAVIAQLSAGGIAKGLMAGFFGLLLATIGTDPIWGQIRTTFGTPYLFDGVTVIAVLVGLLGFSELLMIIERRWHGEKEEHVDKGEVQVGLGEIMTGFKIALARPFQCLRSGLIGIGIGVIPGAGASAASFIAYQQAIAFAPESQRRYFGKGSYDGLVAADASNNAMVGGTLVPLLTLGLPGSATMAVVLVIMQYHGLEIGPRLFQLHGDLAYAVLWSQFLAAPFIFMMGTLLAWGAYRIAYLPSDIIIPVVGVFCLIGGFARNQYLFDMWVMLTAGLVGYYMKKHDYPVIALLLGLILGHLFEGNLFRSLKMGFGSPIAFVERPMALILWAMLLAVFVAPPITRALTRRLRSPAPSLPKDSD